MILVIRQYLNFHASAFLATLVALTFAVLFGSIQIAYAYDINVSKVTKESSTSFTQTSTTSGQLVIQSNAKTYFINKTGKKLKSSWLKWKGNKYYFKKNGIAATGSYKIKHTYYIFDAKGRLTAQKKNEIVTVNGKKYYISQNGKAGSGWFIIKGKLYYANSKGICAKDKTIDNIKINSKCYANPKDATTKLKILAIETVAKIINPDMSTVEKLSACFDYARSCRFIPDKFPDISIPGYKYTCAYEFLNGEGGNCWGFSHGFAALAKEVGTAPYVITPPVATFAGHCWIRINGRYWDIQGNIKNGDRGHWLESAPPTDGYRAIRF